MELFPTVGFPSERFVLAKELVVSWGSNSVDRRIRAPRGDAIQRSSLIRSLSGRDATSYPEPKLLLDEMEISFWGADPPIKGSIGRSDLLIEYAVGSIDPAVHNRREIRHYLVDRDKVVRVDPIVLSPRDFADDWIRHPWREISQWTERAAQPALLKRHEHWNGSRGYGEFDPTLHCEQKPDLGQVGINLRSESGKEQTHRYFLFRWRPPYRFTMVDPGDRPWPGCTERDVEADDEFHTLFPGEWR